MLREHIPPSIRPLAISLTSSERIGLEQLEQGVRTLVQRICTQDITLNQTQTRTRIGP